MNTLKEQVWRMKATTMKDSLYIVVDFMGECCNKVPGTICIYLDICSSFVQEAACTITHCERWPGAKTIEVSPY
eukprot:scaffold4233_cov142-Skeletonema_dohrnii-CCMP3373.AAC.33